MSANKIKEKFEEKKKKGVKLNPPKNTIPRSELQKRLQDLLNLRKEKMDERTQIITNLQNTERKMHEIDSQVKLLNELMRGSPVPPKKPPKKKGK